MAETTNVASALRFHVAIHHHLHRHQDGRSAKDGVLRTASPTIESLMLSIRVPLNRVKVGSDSSDRKLVIAEY